MYARVARFEGGSADALRQAAEDMKARAAGGPPEGVPATGFLMLIDPENGKSLGISFFATEEDRDTGHATLENMTPSGDAGQRSAVEFYEVGVDVKA